MTVGDFKVRKKTRKKPGPRAKRTTVIGRLDSLSKRVERLEKELGLKRMKE